MPEMVSLLELELKPSSMKRMNADPDKDTKALEKGSEYKADKILPGHFSGSHLANVIQQNIQELCWKVPRHPLYSPDFDYHSAFSEGQEVSER
ncbi:hypothetical protein RB195_003717 [Necator americanus]|uniref:Metallo-beta-lactamase domain-containing protein n=1 Tax=Necator americanus TaxID=51031 RepID=A0ABR1DR45_NECAM